jgi:hypothetical protein
MQSLETRSQRRGGNRALAGRNQVQHSDDIETLTLLQAKHLSQCHPFSLEVAITLARLAYAARSS